MKNRNWSELKKGLYKISAFSAMILLILASSLAKGDNQKKSEGLGQIPVVISPPDSLHLNHFYKK
ncbi:MAG TPA: hypothetical protein VGK38_00745, partial [Prolixibacteraceae bacterium]